MCLVKEPTRRPTAERLLRHSFFKHARTSDYIYRHVLDGLPPLGERVKNLKVSVKLFNKFQVFKFSKNIVSTSTKTIICFSIDIAST
jgi:serine/threonine protein kinase